MTIPIIAALEPATQAFVDSLPDGPPIYELMPLDARGMLSAVQKSIDPDLAAVDIEDRTLAVGPRGMTSIIADTFLNQGDGQSIGIAGVGLQLQNAAPVECGGQRQNRVDCSLNLQSRSRLAAPLVGIKRKEQSLQQLDVVLLDVLYYSGRGEALRAAGVAQAPEGDGGDDVGRIGFAENSEDVRDETWKTRMTTPRRKAS